MRIGIDFDNTIAGYGELFHRVAVEEGLVAADVAASKTGVRDALRQAGREDDWTALQGRVYGELIDSAPPFAGVIPFLRECRRREVVVAIISHRTRRPVLGPDVDLHAAARNWISQHLIDGESPLVNPSRVFFEVSREAKLRRIAQLGCTHFIDDLPEFLAETDFPQGVQRILFDPESRHEAPAGALRAASWDEIAGLLLGRRMP